MPGLWLPGFPFPGFTQQIFAPPVKQISPDKNMNFHDTTAPFTVPAGSLGFVILG
jgi:hypothetical protein